MEPTNDPFEQSFQDETQEEFDARMAKLDKEVDLQREEKLKQLEQKTPSIIKLAEKKLANEKLNQQLEEIDRLEASEKKYTALTVQELLEKEFPPQQWIIDRFLPEGGITLIVGEAGTLKSYVCLYLAKILLSQEKLFGQFETHRKCKILLIDKENKLARVQRRMIGLGTPPTSDMWIIQSPETFMLSDSEWVKHTQEFIKENQIDVVILDSFIDFFSGNENSSTDTAMAMNAIRSLSQTVSYIMIHHDSKPIPKLIRTAAQKTRGSSNIIAQVDTQFYFEKGKDNKTLVIEQGKSRDEEPLPKFEIQIISEVDKGVSDFTYLGEIQSEVKLVEQAQDFIYEYLSLNPFSLKDDIDNAGELLTLTGRTIKDALNKMSKLGMVDFTKKPGSGNKHFYFLTTTDDSESSDE